jgi:hypothetical protein
MDHLWRQTGNRPQASESLVDYRATRFELSQLGYDGLYIARCLDECRESPDALLDVLSLALQCGPLVGEIVSLGELDHLLDSLWSKRMCLDGCQNDLSAGLFFIVFGLTYFRSSWFANNRMTNKPRRKKAALRRR